MISLFRCRSALAILAAMSANAALPLVAQEPEDDTRPARILLLGTYHFANPGLDVVKTDVADVLSPAKQSEIRAVVEELMRFRPTMIAVERPVSAAATLDSLYAAYRAGSHTLRRDETEQLGFRLAGHFEHDRVYPIDVRGEFPFGAVMQYAQTNDPEFLSLVQRERGRMEAESNRQQRENTVGEILRLANEPKKLAADHGMYMQFARVGAGDTYVGADLVAKWYDRNIRIFSNIQRLAGPGERILVIIGSGHAPILRELIAYDPLLELVDALEYLPVPRQ